MQLLTINIAAVEKSRFLVKLEQAKNIWIVVISRNFQRKKEKLYSYRLIENEFLKKYGEFNWISRALQNN